MSPPCVAPPPARPEPFSGIAPTDPPPGAWLPGPTLRALPKKASGPRRPAPRARRPCYRRPQASRRPHFGRCSFPRPPPFSRPPRAPGPLPPSPPPPPSLFFFLAGGPRSPAPVPKAFLHPQPPVGPAHPSVNFRELGIRVIFSCEQRAPPFCPPSPGRYGHPPQRARRGPPGLHPSRPVPQLALAPRVGGGGGGTAAVSDVPSDPNVGPFLG